MLVLAAQYGFLQRITEDHITIRRHSIEYGATRVEHPDWLLGFTKPSVIRSDASSLMLVIPSTSSKTFTSTPLSKPPADTPSGNGQ
jgi:hypothetical protein